MSEEQEHEPEEEAEASAGQKARTPPYIAWKTTLTLLSELKTNGIPPQIDRSVLTRFAGGLQSQILMALRSLGLIDSDARPTPRLEQVVDAYETDRFKEVMRPIIKDTYAYVFRLDLMTATPSMFADAFKNNVDAKEDVLRKCRTFFLHAARDLDIPIGPRIMNAKFPRARATGPRKPRAKKKKDEGKQENLNPPPDDGGGRSQPSEVVSQLLSKFPEFDPSWPDDIKAKWFEGFDQFMKMADGKESK